MNGMPSHKTSNGRFVEVHDNLKLNEVKDFHTRMYEKYRSVHGLTNSFDDRTLRAPYIRRLIRKHFPPNREAKILDLGCGSGTLLHFLREAGYGYVSGVDTSPEQVAAAQRSGIHSVRQGNLLDVLRHIETRELDVVVTFDVIEHMTKPELLELSDEVYRVLQKGGKWLIHAPNAGGLFGSRVRYADLTHEQAFTRESLEQLLTAVGFEKIECYEDQPVIHGLMSGSRWLVWKIVRALLRVCWVAETGSIGKDCVFSQNLIAVGHKLS